MLMVVSLCFAGCASHPDESNPWEYKTVKINAFSEASARAEVQQYINQGWMITQMSTNGSRRDSRSLILVMKRPRQVIGKFVIPNSPAAEKQ